MKGQPADNLNALTARMNGAIKGNTFAKSAIETALLDARGKALGLPVSALLGGALQTALPVLWTLASGDTAKDIAEGEKLLAEGRHQAFKLKIGARELATDLRHTRAIVEALGDRASIRVDVNRAGTPPPARKAAANWRRWASILSNSRSAPTIMPPGAVKPAN